MAWLTWQTVGVVLVVGAALFYLVWKMTAGSRPPRRKGPDVPASRLTRRKGGRGGGSSSCH